VVGEGGAGGAACGNCGDCDGIASTGVLGEWINVRSTAILLCPCALFCGVLFVAGGCGAATFAWDVAVKGLPQFGQKDAFVVNS
jgi:hypothetical protein